jgi:glc operon protein GlcG
MLPIAAYPDAWRGSTNTASASMGGPIMRTSVITALALGAALVFSGAAQAQQRPAAAPPAPQPPSDYGMPISTEQAKVAAAAAVAEAVKNGWKMAIAVVEPSGDLVYFEKMQGTQYASVPIAQHKARAAATFRRPTKSFEERVGGGGAGITALTLDGIIASDGGVPIVVGGRVIGAIGASGGTGAQDGQTSTAGAHALR